MNSLDVAYAFGAALLAPVWARKARGGWAERFGATEPLGEPKAGRPRLLLHAVSVGEIGAIRGLVPLLREHAEVVVAASTDTGLARAKELFGAGGPVVRFPLDFSRSVTKFLDAVRPQAVGLVELEVWPNFISACAARGVPVAVVNGRLSAKSFRGYRRVRRIIGPTFARLEWAAVQDAAYAERFVAMGVAPERCRVVGTMKWDSVAMASTVPGAEELAAELGIDRSRPLIVAGSTAEGEEALLHRACPEGVQLLCAPRKPERFDAAAADLPGCVRRTEKRAAPAGTERFLLDTIGELRAAYALADVVVVARSFGKLHGSDPIEPAALGKPVVMGPAYQNFTTVVEALRQDGALVVATAEELPGVLAGLVGARGDAGKRAAMAAAGARCIERHRGSTAEHGRMLLEMVRKAAAGRPGALSSRGPAA